MKKRILVLMSVVALMLVMVAMSVAPAFAAWAGPCRTGDQLVPVRTPKAQKSDRNGDTFVCQAHRGPEGTKVGFYDNRQP